MLSCQCDLLWSGCCRIETVTLEDSWIMAGSSGSVQTCMSARTASAVVVADLADVDATSRRRLFITTTNVPSS